MPVARADVLVPYRTSCTVPDMNERDACFSIYSGGGDGLGWSIPVRVLAVDPLQH